MKVVKISISIDVNNNNVWINAGRRSTCQNVANEVSNMEELEKKGVQPEARGWGKLQWFFEMVLKKLLNEKHSNQPELNEVKSLYKEYWFEVRSKTRYNNVKEFIEDIICNNEENLFNLKSFLKWTLPWI